MSNYFVCDHQAALKRPSLLLLLFACPGPKIRKVASGPKIVAAAVQMDGRIGEVAQNIAKAEGLARRAFAQGAQWVMLPEFFTSPVGFHPALKNVALPPDGPALKMMMGLAAKFKGYLAGSFIVADKGDAYNRCFLCGPEGVLGAHDKDQPTMWENAYYIGGKDDGIIPTPLGPVGAAVCWELIRTRTAKRLAGKIKMLLSGSCWWAPPPVPLLNLFVRTADRQNRKIVAETPARFARLLGAPVIHAGHCARFSCATPYVPWRPFNSYYLGETQIVAADGTILARRTFEQGEGIVIAEVSLGDPEPLDPLPRGFWIPDLPLWMRAAWTYQNFHGKRAYRRMKQAQEFGWQK